MKKLLILYLSNTGNTKEIADIISNGNFNNNIYTEIVHFNDAIQPLIDSYEYIAIGLPEKEKITDVIMDFREKFGDKITSYELLEIVEEYLINLMKKI